LDLEDQAGGREERALFPTGLIAGWFYLARVAGSCLTTGRDLPGSCARGNYLFRK
jgi:hypothetical protein